MYIKDIFNPNQKKKLKGNKLVDNPKNLNSVMYKCTAKTQYNNTLHLIRFLAPDKHAQGKSLSSLNRQIMAELKPICY